MAISLASAAMFHPTRTNAVVWAGLLVAVAALHGELQGQDNAGQPPPDTRQNDTVVLVLQNGGVLFGRIALSGDRYVLSGRGGEMYIPAANVMLIASSLEEAYDQRRKQLARPTTEAHLALADWCLRHGLALQAERELSDARALEPRHPRLGVLERRLALAGERPQQPTSQPATNEAPALRPHSPQSQLAISDLPSGAVERFTRKVQPVLVNNCTGSGCHQRGGSEPFQLDRALLQGVANRRSTMHNLAATLALVNHQRPELSPLLTVGRRAHGGISEPVFGPRQEPAFRHLVAWVALVTQSEPWEEETVAVAAQEDAEPPAANPVEQAVNLESASMPAIEDGLPASYEADASLLLPAPRLRYGVELQPWQPRDPFDPEIFNRRQPSRSPTPGFHGVR